MTRYSVRGGTPKPEIVKLRLRPATPAPSDLKLERRTMTLTWKGAVPGATYSVLRNRRDEPWIPSTKAPPLTLEDLN